MDLNWTPEVIADLVVGSTLIVLILLTFAIPKTKRILSLFCIRLSFICLSFFFLLGSLAILFLNLLLMKLSVIFLFPACIFLIIGVNYSMKDSFYSISLFPVFFLGALLCYLVFQPGTIELRVINGIQTFYWVGLFNIIAYSLIAIFAIYTFYWGLKTWISAPFLIKKEATIFFFGTNIFTITGVIISTLTSWDPNLEILGVVLGDIFTLIGILFFLISISREPKLLYILPFTVYRILVKDKEGYPLFDHDWSKTDISELMFTGFINAIQVMSEEVIKKGGLVDIHLKEGILILYESELFTVGLVASKSSKLLRESLVNFSNDFQKMFERELKKSVRDMAKYESAYELIEKYFSNFPYRIITSKNYPLLLSGKFMKIPLELDNKLKKFITDEEDYEFIKSELYKYPPSQSEDFLKLYDEIKENLDKLPKEDYEHLDLEYDEDT